MTSNVPRNTTEIPELVEGLEWIGNVSKPTPNKCLPACNFQENDYQMSFALDPLKDNFFYQKKFCHVATHILNRTCGDENRRYFLDKSLPNLCNVLTSFDEYFGNISSCKKWPNNYLSANNVPNETLVEEMYQYGKTNLALVKIMIQSPYVTKIKRDVAMTFTDFIANSGGLLGLCLGFSFISGIEILFWFCCCCKEFKEKVDKCCIYNKGNDVQSLK